MSPAAEVQLVAALAAATCALPGVWLVLRGEAMLADAVSHSVLLGIVLAFLATGSLDGPAIVPAAAACGVLTVAGVELLQRTRLVRADAAIGLVFPVLFSIAVILIARGARNVHLDTDAVLLGELAFVPLDRLIVRGADWGPRGAWTLGGALAANLLFVGALYKELKLACFDPGLAETLGLRPRLIGYALTTLVSITAVCAFDAVGSVLVVALMIAPPAAACLLTTRLAVLLPVAVGLGVGGALAGHRLATAADTNIAGAIAVTQGALFGGAWLLAPRRGLIAVARRRAAQRREFPERMLLVHLMHHSARGDEVVENAVATLHEHLGWSPEATAKVLARVTADGRVMVRDGRAELSEAGRVVAGAAMIRTD